MCFFSCFSGNCCISVCAPCLSPCHFTPPRMRDPNFFMTSVRYPHTLTEPPKPSLLQANHHQVPMPLLISEATRSPQMIPAGEPRTRPSSPGVPPSNSEAAGSTWPNAAMLPSAFTARCRLLVTLLSTRTLRGPAKLLSSQYWCRDYSSLCAGSGISLHWIP